MPNLITIYTLVFAHIVILKLVRFFKSQMIYFLKYINADTSQQTRKEINYPGFLPGSSNYIFIEAEPEKKIYI